MIFVIVLYIEIIKLYKAQLNISQAVHGAVSIGLCGVVLL